MRITRTIGVIALCCLVGFGCAAGNHTATSSYVVQPHDTLYSIAWRHDLDYHDLARWNHIGSDHRIAVGQVLVLRPQGRRASGAGSSSGSRAPAAAAGSAAGRALGAQGSAALRPPPSVGWVWPTQHATPPRPVPGGGILLFGDLGQPVHAAAPGRVVYVGNGLRAYGNLIIIKHGESWLSAYAHLEEALVREGQDVTSAELIARMGEGPHQVAALYFEIRLNGKPVDPLSYLGAVK